jgi:hypothetical protein
MKIWDWIARHGGGVQRRQDWVHLLGNLFSDWEPLLKKVPKPSDIRFWAQLGGGEEEYVVHQDRDGFWAVPVDGGAARRLNPTQAEFDQLDLEQLFTQLRSEAALDGSPTRLVETANSYLLGHRTIEGRTVAVFFVPYARDLFDQKGQFLSPDLTVNVVLVLVPSPAAILPNDRAVLRRQHILLGQLPICPPWAIDWSGLANTSDLGFEFEDLGALCGRRFVLIVDKKQRKAWIEGRPIKLKADTQSYRLLEYLAERPGVAVPDADLVTQVLESNSVSMEAKIVDDAKRELKKPLRNALDGVPTPRITADTLIRSDGRRQSLNLDSSQVFMRS